MFRVGKALRKVITPNRQPLWVRSSKVFDASPIRNKFFAAFLFILIVFSIALGTAHRIPTQNSDTSNFLSFIGQEAIFPPLQSRYSATMYELDYLIAQDKSVVCEKVFNPPRFSNNFFKIHPYVLAPIIAVSSFLLPIPVNWIAAFWLAASATLGLFGIFIFLRRVGVKSLGSILILATVVLYPVYTESLIGQIYMDQLIIGPGICLFFLVWWMRYRSVSVWKWAVALTLILGSISERGAYCGMLISLVYISLLFGTHLFRKREVAYVAISGALCLVWGLLWTKYIQDNFRIAGISFQGSMNRLHSLFYETHYNDLFVVFLAVSATWFIVSLLSGRGFLVMLLAVAPNLLVDVGGAELTGFTTHYHQTYLPILLASGTVGIVRVATFKFNRKNISTIFGLCTCAIFLTVSLFIWTNHGLHTPVDQRLKSARILLAPVSLPQYISDRSTTEHSFREVALFVASLDPNKVSVPEFLTPALYIAGVQNIHYWPVGVSKADVVIAPWDENGPNPFPFGFWGDTEPTLRACILEELSINYKLVGEYLGNTLRIYQKIS